MEFWETLYIIDLFGMMALFILNIFRVWDVVEKRKKFTDRERSVFHKWTWLLFILNILSFGIAFFTFTINYAQNLLISLTRLITMMFVLNFLFFIIQWIYVLKDQADEVVEAYKPENFNLGSNQNFRT